MNRDKLRYLSHRATLLFAALILLALLLLAAVAALAFSTGRMVWLVAVFALLLGLVLALGYYWVLRPYQESAKVLRLFSGGYLVESFFEQRIPLSPQYEQALRRFQEILNTRELLTSSKRQAQYLALQNQINPHFLYNTLEGIRGETMSAGLDHVSKMTEALATYFRYTISNVENLVTLEEELGNIDNYYIIQRYRFGERLNLQVEMDPEDEKDLMRCKLPKLTLQPIVENAIYHGLERKLGRGEIRIKLELTPGRLIITVSDNGLGIEEGKLRELNRKLGQISLTYSAEEQRQEKKGIAMVNVNTRIQLLFGEDYGLYIYSTPDKGTDVVITLMRTEESIEEIYERRNIAPQ